MVGRHYDGHACCSHYLRVSLEVNLLGPPFGVAAVAFIEILGEGEKKGIGQNYRFVVA
jgi:hypothetical protein